ncbi:MAG: hypothetical protein ACI4GO_08875 [Hominenteromicrobium sp.]
MKKYVKADVLITEFALNETVAVCDPTTVYNQVTVPCLKTGTHTLFYTNCDTNYNNCKVFNYNGTEYLIWDFNNGGGSSGGGLGQDKLFDEVAKAAQRAGVISSTMVHIGPITPDITSVVNSSI